MIDQENGVDTNSSDSSSLDLKSIIFIVKSNLKIIFLIAFSGFFLSFFFLYISLPSYESTGVVYLNDDKESSNPFMDLALGRQKNFVENEIEFLKSRTIAELTINKLINSENENGLYILGTRDENFDLSLPQRALRKVLFFEIDHIELDKPENYPDSLFFDAVNSLQENIVVSNKRNTDLLNISYQSFNANEAAIVVNAVMDVYQERDKQWQNDELNYLKSFLEQQLLIKKKDLNQIEEKLKDFQESNNVYELDSAAVLLIEQLKLIEAAYYESKTESEILNERKKYYENQLNVKEENFSSLVTNTLNTQLSSLREELGILEAEYISTKSKNSNSAALESMKIKIDNLKNAIANETEKLVKSDIRSLNPLDFRQGAIDSLLMIRATEAGLATKNKELEKTILNYEQQLRKLPNKYLLLSRLQRDRIILDQTYSTMKQKLEETKINEASQLGKVRIVDPAIPNYDKVSPQTLIILILTLIGIFVTIVLVLILKEYLDSTIRNLEEIENRNISILSIIPEFKTSESGDKLKRRLILNEDPKSPISEAYRSIRTSLSLNESNDIQSNVILVSSSGPGEGKSTTVANLAITYANLGKKTLIIDTDLRKPVQHKIFNKSKKKGLTTSLSKQDSEIFDVIESTENENLSLLSSGPTPPNPSEILSSKRFKNIIESLRKEFDIIIFDSPPLIAVTDSLILSNLSDQFLLVIKAGQTDKNALDRSIQSLEQVGSKIVGCIVNGANESTTYGGNYYYYNYYQYYYGTEEKD
tara:strand:+ start:1523 stop:3808 length:2286 start_codon:yes stop_codon:yes gene_type:complete